MANNHTHVLYGSTLNMDVGDIKLALKNEGSLNPVAGTAYLYLRSSDSHVTVRKNGPVDVDLEGGGGGVTDPLLLGDNSAAAPAYSFTTGPSYGMFKNAVPELAFSAAGIEALSMSGTAIYRKLPEVSYSPGTSTRTICKYHSARTIATTGSTYRTVATINIPDGAACMITTEGVARTGSTQTLEVIKTFRTIARSGNTITEIDYVDETITESWRYLLTTGTPDTYELQLREDATNSKYATVSIRIFQTNNSNVTITF